MKKSLSGKIMGLKELEEQNRQPEPVLKLPPVDPVAIPMPINDRIKPYAHADAVDDRIAAHPGEVVKGNLLVNDKAAEMPVLRDDNKPCIVSFEYQGKVYNFADINQFAPGPKSIFIETAAGNFTVSDNGDYKFVASNVAFFQEGGVLTDKLTYTIEQNGHKDTATISIAVGDNVRDDIDLEAVTEDRSLAALGRLLNATGNVLANDLLLPTTKLTGVSIGGVIVSFSQPTGIDADGKFVLVEGQHGTLKMYENGNYSYAAVDGVGSSEHFEYLLTNANGIVSSVPLTIDIRFICVMPGAPVEPEITINPIGHIDDVSVSDPNRFLGNPKEVPIALPEGQDVPPVVICFPMPEDDWDLQIVSLQSTSMVLSDLLPEHNSLDNLLPAALAVEPQDSNQMFAVANIETVTHAVDMQVMNDILKTDDDTSAV